MPRTREASKLVRDERRQQILKAATGVFASKGLANTKIEDLAKAAGMSQGLLYRYFANKTDVFAAVLDQLAEETIRIAKAAFQMDGNPWEQLRWLTEQVLVNLQKTELRKVAEQASGLVGAGSNPMRRLGKALYSAVLELIIAGQDAQLVVKGDPNMLSILYFACLQGLASTIDLFDRSLRAHFPNADVVLRSLARSP